MREAGLEPPVTTVRTGAVVVTFDVAAALEARGWPAVLPIDPETGKTTGKTPVAVLDLFAGNPNLTVPELAVRLGKAELTIHRAIRKLRESGRLERIGPDKGGHWKVLDAPEEPH